MTYILGLNAYHADAGISLTYVMSRLRNRGERADTAGNLKRHLPAQEFRCTTPTVEHHLCHLASAFLVSPYDKAVAVSVDGFGDFFLVAWGLGDGGNLSVDGRVYFPHSLGVCYEAMTQFIGFREEKRTEIRAVTHVDGTGRLQTVTWAGTPRYARLISAFRDRTGVPIALNTSFDENEPVVCRPAEAIDCFLRIRMDVLVLGDTLIQR